MNNLKQIEYDVYETLLKDLEAVTVFVKKDCKELDNANILKSIRTFIYEKMGLKWEDICVILNEEIIYDHKNPLRVYFNKELYFESINQDKLH